MNIQERILAEREITNTFDELKDCVRRLEYLEADQRQTLFKLMDVRRDIELQHILIEFRTGRQVRSYG